jgi:zinc transporter, ZIP family
LDVLILLLAGSGTALATGIGAVPVFLLGTRAEALRPALWGMAIGVMGVASIVGLLIPALNEGSPMPVGAGLVLGVAFLVVARRRLRSREIEADKVRQKGARSAALVFLVLFVHSLPEGFAIGTAYASDTAGLSLFVILAIALQNVPEGTSVAIPMASAGYGKSQQFWAAVATSAPQPVGAVVAFVLVEQVESLLPLSFAFAAGAMLALVMAELVPQAFTTPTWQRAAIGTAVGAAVMLALSAVLGV